MLTICVFVSDNIGFLLSDTARLIRRRFDERARAIGITRPQWRVLLLLIRQEGATQGALADLLEVEPITLCRMIDRLEEAGHVERRRDPADRRAWNIYLTDRARPLLDRLRAIADDLFEDGLSGLDSAQRAALNDSLALIRSNLSLSKDQAAHG